MKLKQDFGIRALLATIVVTIATGVLAYLSIIGSSEALVALVATISAVIGYYFGLRSTSGGNSSVS